MVSIIHRRFTENSQLSQFSLRAYDLTQMANVKNSRVQLRDSAVYTNDSRSANFPRGARFIHHTRIIIVSPRLPSHRRVMAAACRHLNVVKTFISREPATCSPTLTPTCLQLTASES